MQPVISEPKTKIISLKASKNPELQELRESVLSQKVNYSEVAANIKDQVKQIHAGYLFLNHGGKIALAALCKVISSTPASPHFSSWKDLGSVLGISNLQLGCIEQLKYGDPTELVLKTYSQHVDSTLDQIVSALQAINRFDAIIEAEDGLLDLAKIARQEQIKRTEDTEGIYSIFGKGTIDGILRPEYVETLSYQLPITLRGFPEKSLFITEPLKCDVKLENSSAIIKKEKKFSKAVMLTFASDGEEIARKVAKQFRTPRGKHLPIGVLMLEDHAEKVLENPEKFIFHIFPQVHYVIPIITKGYLTSLENGAHQGSSLSSIDTQYVQFIHDLMMKEYIKNNCKNKRFRCIIPDEEFQSVLNHKHMEFDPVLKVYEKESESELLACRILKIKWKDNASHFNRTV